MEGPKDEHALSKLRTEQLLCIRSIPSYVESSEMFLALVPPLQNASTTTTATLPVGSATVGAGPKCGASCCREIHLCQWLWFMAGTKPSLLGPQAGFRLWFTKATLQCAGCAAR
eukprot:s3545_g4.t1